MNINNLETLSGNQTYFENQLLVWYDSFLPYVSGNYQLVEVKPHLAYKYQGDFYGLLEVLGVSKIHHRYVMVFNDMINSVDYDGLVTSIKIPNMEIIDTLRLLN